MLQILAGAECLGHGIEYIRGGLEICGMLSVILCDERRVAHIETGSIGSVIEEIDVVADAIGDRIVRDLVIEIPCSGIMSFGTDERTAIEHEGRS